MTSLLTEAWRTLVPVPGEKHGPLPPLLLGLTMVTGLVDSFSYLVLGHVFVANMTGNVVFLAFALAGAAGFSLLASVAAIGAFVLGAFVGGRVAGRVGHHRGHLLVAVTTFQVALVAVAAVIVASVHTPGSGAARYSLIVVLSLSMGAQNAAARRLAVPDLTTTVLTLTITGIAADSRLAGGDGSKAGRRLMSALSMFIGTLIGTFLVLKVSPQAAILAIVGLLCVLAATTAVLSKSNPSWVHAPP